MYIGPGSDSMMSAAEAWAGLASELYTTANAYQSAIASLTAGTWIGPSSASMAAAAASYVSWLKGAATQAEEAATQARAAAAAYEEAFASTVPPPLVTANRTRLARLLASNLFGQNTSAIATTEAQYAEMWAQDAAAMYRYAGSSASATALTPFESPRQNTNPGGQAAQTAAITQATGTSAGNVQQTLSAVPTALQSLATATPSSSLGTLSDLISIFLDLPADVGELAVDVPLSTLGIVSLPLDIGGYGTGVHSDELISGWAGEASWPNHGPAPIKEFPAPLTNLRPGTVPVPKVSAGLGDANPVGNLSVPATWTIATPAVLPISYTMPELPAAAGPEGGSTPGSSTTWGQMALAGMAGRAIAGTLGTGAGKDGGKAQRRERVQACSGAVKIAEDAAADDSGGPLQSEPRPVITGVALELREFVKLRDEGILTDDEYAEQKNRLLGR
jgi:PPE-repeat protein